MSGPSEKSRWVTEYRASYQPPTRYKAVTIVRQLPAYHAFKGTSHQPTEYGQKWCIVPEKRKTDSESGKK